MTAIAMPRIRPMYAEYFVASEYFMCSASMALKTRPPSIGKAGIRLNAPRIRLSIPRVKNK